MDTNLPQLLTRLALDVVEAQRELEAVRPGWQFDFFQIDLPIKAHHMEMRGFEIGADVLFLPLTRYYYAGRKDFSEQCRLQLDVQLIPCKP